MTKHTHVLRQHIKAGQVSLHSTALPGFDDVPGLLGVQLHDAYAQQFFLNQCLYMAKGMAKYVTVLHPEQFVIPANSSVPGGEGSSFVSGLLAQFESAGARVTTSARSKARGSNSTASSALASSGTAATTYCSFALGAGAVEGSTLSRSHPPGTVVGNMEVYGVEDPVEVMGAWGPGESTWSRGESCSLVVPAVMIPLRGDAHS
jgi:hypothetical protein